MGKIRVGILGATGMVGQQFIECLEDHPWFEITALAASERSVGKSLFITGENRELPLLPCTPNLPCDVVFSGLDSSVAGDIEMQFAQSGYTVISNSRNHRMDPRVPLLIPEVNSDHLELLKTQPFNGGHIVTNPNCSAIGVTMALKPLLDLWDIASVHVVTLQALSGAGYPGVPSLAILDNVIPFIPGEEEKIEKEPLKILGTYQDERIIPHALSITAQCNRVAVTDGHLACISVKFKEKMSRDELIDAWLSFKGEPQRLALPSAPKQPIHYLDDPSHPQPKLHRQLEKGMAISIGRLRSHTPFDWTFVVLSHNRIRGAAGCALLNAELMLKQGYLTLPCTTELSRV